MKIRNMNKRYPNPGPFRKNRGFSLLEALIGFMILSIGMLGIASLQAVSLKAGKTSVYNSVAMMKVDEIFESMRANPTGLASYTGGAVNNSCTGTKVCTATQLAQDDLYWWTQSLSAGLPAGVTSAVTYTAPVAGSQMATMTVTLGWKERNKDTGGSVDKSYASTATICQASPC
jgi:type IV pilus assembly protein PilV